jgi:hypothetical protein
MSEQMQGELLQILNGLPAAEQRRVVDFARALSATRPHGARGEDLLQFAGAISQEDLARMSAAIEDACEKVDPDAW